MAEKKNIQDSFKPAKKQKNSFRDFIDGSILTKKAIVKQFPFIIFLTLLAIIYITNRLHAESIARQTEITKKEIEKLRAKSLIIVSQLMNISNRSQVLKSVEENKVPITESKEPPKVIIYKNNSKEQ